MKDIDLKFIDESNLEELYSVKRILDRQISKLEDKRTELLIRSVSLGIERVFLTNNKKADNLATVTTQNDPEANPHGLVYTKNLQDVLGCDLIMLSKDSTRSAEYMRILIEKIKAENLFFMDFKFGSKIFYNDWAVAYKTRLVKYEDIKKFGLDKVYKETDKLLQVVFADDKGQFPENPKFRPTQIKQVYISKERS